MIQRRKFSAREMRLVESGSVDWPPLVVGDACNLNSGGPRCLVVDIVDLDLESRIVVATPDGAEYTAPRACVHRVA